MTPLSFSRVRQPAWGVVCGGGGGVCDLAGAAACVPAGPAVAAGVAACSMPARPAIRSPRCFSVAAMRCVIEESASRSSCCIDSAIRNGVQYLDVQNWVCDPDNCPVIVGNILVYRDSHHLTTNYVRFLTPLFAEAVTPYVNGVRSRISTS